MRIFGKEVSNKTVALVGTAIGVLVDVAITILIPGASLIETIVAFIGGMTTGLAFMKKYKATHSDVVLHEIPVGVAA
jgi:hypothetical protein